MKGFCTLHQDDVPVGVDRRCLTDNSLTIPPSTGCCHQRWLNGAWSKCTPEGQATPCKPVAAGTWRTTLDGKRKAPTPVESEQNAAVKRFGHGEPVPTLRAQHKPLRTQHKPISTRVSPRRCQTCGVVFRPVSTDTESPWCSAECQVARVVVGQVIRGVPVTACPICDTPFLPFIGNAGRRRVVCSRRCVAAYTIRARQTGTLPCSDCQRTDRPFYRFGRCRPCFDAWDEAQRYRRVAS